MFDSRSNDIIYRWMYLKVIHNFPDNRITDLYEEIKFHENFTVSTVPGPSTSGYQFTHWEIKEGHTNHSDLSQLNVNIEMLYDNVTIEAMYKKVYYLTVISGSGEGWYDPLDKIYVLADPDPTGMYFSHWYSQDYQDSFEDFYNRSTYFHMPYENTTIQAVYKWFYYNLSVIYGSGGGSYHYAENVVVTADNKFDEGLAFDHWSIVSDPSGTGHFLNPNAQIATYIMSLGNSTVRAYYHWIMWDLYIRADGENSILHYFLHKGQSHTVTGQIRTNDGYKFLHWAEDDGTNNPFTGGEIISESITGQDESMDDPYNISTTWYHGNEDFHIKAVYEWIQWNLIVRYNGEDTYLKTLHKQESFGIEATDRYNSDGYDFNSWQWDDNSNDPFTGGGIIPTSDPNNEEYVLNNTARSTIWIHGNRDNAIKAVYEWHNFTLNIRRDGENNILTYNDIHKGDVKNISAIDRLNSDGYEFDSWQWDDGTNNPLTGNGLIQSANPLQERHVLNNTQINTSWKHGVQDDNIKAVYKWYITVLRVRSDGMDRNIYYDLHYKQTQSISAKNLNNWGYVFKYWGWDDNTSNPFQSNGIIQSEDPLISPNHVLNAHHINTQWMHGLNNKNIKAVYAWIYYTLNVRYNGVDIYNYSLHKGQNQNIYATDREPQGQKFYGWVWDDGTTNPLTGGDLLPLNNAEELLERHVIDHFDPSTVWKHGNQNDNIKAMYEWIIYTLQIRYDGTHITNVDAHKGEEIDISAENREDTDYLGFIHWAEDNGSTDPLTGGPLLSEQASGQPLQEEQVVDNLAMFTTWKHGNRDYIIKAVYKLLKFPLTVLHGETVNGTFDDYYTPETLVQVKADPGETGKEFDFWGNDDCSAPLNEPSGGTVPMETISDKNSDPAYWKTGGRAYTISACYKWIYYSLTVNSGSGDGSYHYTEEVGISPDNAPEHYKFNYWGWNDDNGLPQCTTTLLVRCLKSYRTTKDNVWVMGNQSDTIKAVYIQYQFKLTVNNGSSSTSAYHDEYTNVSISASCPSHHSFSSWSKSGEGSIGDSTASSTYYTMGHGDAEVTASCPQIEWQVNILGGHLTKNGVTYSSAWYSKSSSVSITADIPSGAVWYTWILAPGDDTSSTDGNSSTTITTLSSGKTYTAYALVHKFGTLTGDSNFTQSDEHTDINKDTANTNDYNCDYFKKHLSSYNITDVLSYIPSIPTNWHIRTINVSFSAKCAGDTNGNIGYWDGVGIYISAKRSNNVVVTDKDVSCNWGGSVYVTRKASVRIGTDSEGHYVSSIDSLKVYLRSKSEKDMSLTITLTLQRNSVGPYSSES